MHVLTQICLIAIGFLVNTGFALAQQNDDQVNNVLEQLEKQILSDDADGLTHMKSPNGPFGTEDETAPVTSPTGKSKNAESSKDFSQINAQIKSLDRDIEKLAADVQEYKQSAVVASKDNSYVYFEAKVLDAEKSTLKSLRVKVDGFTVYHVKDTAGLWIPNSSIPLYSGPLSAGNHRIDIEANVGHLPGAGLPLAGPAYRSVEKTFEIQVPLGSTNKRYQLAIAPGGDQTGPTVSLNDSL